MSEHPEVEAHVIEMRTRLNELSTKLRVDLQRFDEPKAKALYETAAEVLIGLEKAFRDYELKEEPAWKE